MNKPDDDEDDVAEVMRRMQDIREGRAPRVEYPPELYERMVQLLKEKYPHLFH